MSEKQLRVLKHVKQIMKHKLELKTKVVYGRPVDKDTVVRSLYAITVALKRNGLCFLCGEGSLCPLGVAMRTSSFSLTLTLMHKLMQHGYIDIKYETDGEVSADTRIVIEGKEPGIYQLSENLSKIVVFENQPPQVKQAFKN